LGEALRSPIVVICVNGSGNAASPLARDDDDDFLIDLAFKAQADFIITYNQKDLQPVERFGIRVVTPKQFLQIIGEIES
jgi:predicted nucleic acid-binding protein